MATAFHTTFIVVTVIENHLDLLRVHATIRDERETKGGL